MTTGTIRMLLLYATCLVFPGEIDVSRPLIAQDKLFHRQNGRASFLTSYSGPRVGLPCPTTIHMKDTLNSSIE